MNVKNMGCPNCNSKNVVIENNILKCDDCNKKFEVVVKNNIASKNICQSCGNELNDGDMFCSKCGKKIEQIKDDNTLHQLDDYSPVEWIVSILALLCSVSLFFSESLIDYTTGLTAIALLSVGLFFLPPISDVISYNFNIDFSRWQKFLISLAIVFILFWVGIFIDAAKEDLPVTANMTEEEKEEYYYSGALFYGKILDNYQLYNGKEIKMFISVSSYDKNSKTINVLYHENEMYIKFSKNIDAVANEKMVVSGTVYFNTETNKLYLTNAKAIVKGTITDEKYKESQDAYSEEIRIQAENEAKRKLEEIENFKNNCLNVTYNELYRYPDKYQSIGIKCNLKITNIDVSTSLFSSDVIYASLNGQEVVLYDEREEKEPTISVGDYITVYGYGGGNTVKYEYRVGSGIFGTSLGAEKQNEHYVPTIKATIIKFN